MKPAWYRYDAARKCATLTLHVQPNARRSEAAGLHGDALKVRIAAPAADSKANMELIRFLGTVLGAPRSAFTLRRGATSRRKVMEIAAGPAILDDLMRLVVDPC